MAAHDGRQTDGIEGGQAIFSATDVGVKEQVDAVVARAVSAWGTVDILVNNAWSGPPMGRIEWKTSDEMEAALRIGFLSNFWSMQAVFPHMKAKKWGRIVNMCSLNGVNAHMYTVPYNAAKEAVRSLTRTAAREWAPHGICCNVICPAAATEAYLAVMKANPEMEKDLLLRSLQHHSQNIKRTAEHLGVSRVTLYRLMEKYSIDSQRGARP